MDKEAEWQHIVKTPYIPGDLDFETGFLFPAGDEAIVQSRGLLKKA